MALSKSNPLNDPRAEAVLKRLHKTDARQFRRAIPYFVSIVVRQLVTRRDYVPDMDYLRDKLIALDPVKCEVAYSLCRSLNAKLIVEVGTSFGVSTIYLAAAARDNARTGDGVARVIGTEIEPRKVAAARANLKEAGLADFVDVREGDALVTLNDVPGPVDFVLIDTWINLAKPALVLLAPKLRPGAIVLCDNTVQFARQYREYLDYVRDPKNGFRTTSVPYKGGIEISVRAR